MAYKFSQRSIDNMRGIHPKLIGVLFLALNKSSIDFTVTDGLRTTTQQQALYAQGRTKPGAIVTNADGVKSKSNHQEKSDGFGHAIDLYPYYNGMVQLNDNASLKKIAVTISEAAMQLGVAIKWGGEFTSIADYPHFELA